VLIGRWLVLASGVVANLGLQAAHDSPVYDSSVYDTPLSRYGWLHVQAVVAGFTVTNFTAVCQAIPINYGTVDSVVAKVAFLPAITSITGPRSEKPTTIATITSKCAVQTHHPPPPKEPHDCRDL